MSFSAFKPSVTPERVHDMLGMSLARVGQVGGLSSAPAAAGLILALLALGRLDSLSTFLPDISLFLHMYVRKAAVLSSMIEGTRSSLSNLLLFELDTEPGGPMGDVREQLCGRPGACPCATGRGVSAAAPATDQRNALHTACQGTGQ